MFVENKPALTFYIIGIIEYHLIDNPGINDRDTARDGALAQVGRSRLLLPSRVMRNLRFYNGFS